MTFLEPWLYTADLLPVSCNKEMIEVVVVVTDVDVVAVELFGV